MVFSVNIIETLKFNKTSLIKNKDATKISETMYYREFNFSSVIELQTSNKNHMHASIMFPPIQLSMSAINIGLGTDTTSLQCL